MNRPPKLAYFAYSFTGGKHGTGTASSNTKWAGQMAKKIMEKHPDVFVLVPHYAVDAMLDGTITWRRKDWDERRRMYGGMMSLALVAKCDIFILGCPPEYKYSHGVTWEWVFVNLLNRSWRKDNPIKIVTLEEMMKNERK